MIRPPLRLRVIGQHSAALLGTTIPWDRLSAQVKGLHELSEDQQLRALDAVSARSRSVQPLAALITIDIGMPHPHYRPLARQTGDAQAARTAWQKAVAEVHASYRLVPPAPAPKVARAETRTTAALEVQNPFLHLQLPRRHPEAASACRVVTG